MNRRTVDPGALDQIVENVETKIGPHIGARAIARAWADPEFKRRLLTMPFDWYKRIKPADLDAIVAFVRTIKAVKSQ